MSDYKLVIIGKRDELRDIVDRYSCDGWPTSDGNIFIYQGSQRFSVGRYTGLEFCVRKLKREGEASEATFYTARQFLQLSDAEQEEIICS